MAGEAVKTFIGLELIEKGEPEMKICTAFKGIQKELEKKKSNILIWRSYFIVDAVRARVTTEI